MIPEISASKVAGFIGLHKYQKQDEVAYELLCKNAEAKIKIQALELLHDRKPYNKLVTDVLKDSAVRDCISGGLAAAKTTTNVEGVLVEVQQQAAAVLALRRDDLPEDLRNRLVDEVRGKVATQRGLDNEDGILNQYESAREVKVTERNTKTIKKDFGDFKLVGRCDGYVASQNRIVDSKDRTRVWPQVPLYDEIQLRAYMVMYNTADAELIERFPDRTTRHTVFTNDTEKWKHLEALIRRGVEKLNLALSDEEELKRIVFANTVSIKKDGSEATHATTAIVNL